MTAVNYDFFVTTVMDSRYQWVRAGDAFDMANSVLRRMAAAGYEIVADGEPYDVWRSNGRLREAAEKRGLFADQPRHDPSLPRPYPIDDGPASDGITTVGEARDGRWVAPWTDDQLIELHSWQRDPRTHSYTCGAEHDGERVLFATRQGWICPADGCRYTQNWAHATGVSAGLRSRPDGETPDA